MNSDTNTAARYDAALARYIADEADLIRDIDALEMRLSIVREYRAILEGTTSAPRAPRKRRGAQQEQQAPSVPAEPEMAA